MYQDTHDPRVHIRVSVHKTHPENGPTFAASRRFHVPHLLRVPVHQNANQMRPIHVDGDDQLVNAREITGLWRVVGGAPLARN